MSCSYLQFLVLQALDLNTASPNMAVDSPQEVVPDDSGSATVAVAPQGVVSPEVLDRLASLQMSIDSLGSRIPVLQSCQLQMEHYLFQYPAGNILIRFPSSISLLTFILILQVMVQWLDLAVCLLLISIRKFFNSLQVSSG